MRRRPMHESRLETFLGIAVALSLLFVAIPSSASADPAAPVVSYSIDGVVGLDGWYRGSTHGNYIVVHWSVSGDFTSTSGCEPAQVVPGPTGGTTRTCSATGPGGTTTVTTKTLMIDADPPVLSAVAVTSKKQADMVHWQSTSPADTAIVQKWSRGAKAQQVVFTGAGSTFADQKVRPDIEYRYAVQTTDQAGNPSQRIIVAALPKVLTLGARTSYVPQVASKPILRWPRKRGARYYNVQLYRGSKRIFAAWPAKNELGLPAGWRWNGKRQRLSPGKYRWYVWAGFGARSFAHYQTVGSAQFIVPR